MGSWENTTVGSGVILPHLCDLPLVLEISMYQAFPVFVGHGVRLFVDRSV